MNDEAEQLLQRVLYPCRVGCPRCPLQTQNKIILEDPLEFLIMIPAWAQAVIMPDPKTGLPALPWFKNGLYVRTCDTSS